MNRKLHLTIGLVLVATMGFAQASWTGKLYFNLRNAHGDTIKTEDLLHKDIKIVSTQKDDYITYSNQQKSFVYCSGNFPTERRVFFIITKNDTLTIEFPALKQKCLYIKTPIKIENNKVYNFNSAQVIDFMVNNKSGVITKTFDALYYFDQPVITLVVKKERKKVFKHLEEVMYKEE